MAFAVLGVDGKEPVAIEIASCDPYHQAADRIRTEGRAMTSEELIERFIEENPFRPGVADARLTDSGVPVWAIIGYLPAVGDNPDRVAKSYDLPREAVDAALAYYDRHRRVIDARIAANEIPVT